MNDDKLRLVIEKLAGQADKPGSFLVPILAVLALVVVMAILAIPAFTARRRAAKLAYELAVMKEEKAKAEFETKNAVFDARKRDAAIAVATAMSRIKGIEEDLLDIQKQRLAIRSRLEAVIGP